MSRRSKPSPALGWMALALAFELVLALVDGLSAEHIILTTAYVIAPLALAIVAGPREVGVVTAVAIALSLASGEWNDFFLSTDHVGRLTGVLTAGVPPMLSARGRPSPPASRPGAPEGRAAGRAPRPRVAGV